MIGHINSSAAAQPMDVEVTHQPLVVDNYIPGPDRSNASSEKTINSRVLSSVEVSTLKEAGEIRKTAFKDVVYVWVVPPGAFDPDRDETPILNYQGKQFLQNAIAHSKNYNVKILFLDKNTNFKDKENVEKSFNHLEERLKNEGLNVQLVDGNKILPDSKLKSEMLNNKGTGVSVDLLKMYAGANLGELGLEDALIADFDTELPPQLSVNMCDSSVMPMVDKSLRYIKDYEGYIEHFVENGYCFVSGESNRCYQGMLDQLEGKIKDGNSLNVNGVYTQYVCSTLRELTAHDVGSVAIDDETLLNKYGSLSCIGGNVKNAVDEYKIDFERGGTWQGSAQMNRGEAVPLDLKSSSKPVYDREVDSLYRGILFADDDELKVDNLIKHLDGMIEKGFDVNEVARQPSLGIPGRQGWVLDKVVDKMKGNGLYRVCDYLLKKGAVIPKDTFEKVKPGKKNSFREETDYDDRLNSLFNQYMKNS